MSVVQKSLRGRLARLPAAFTLVELLVVIGIIALLISILLPSLAKARESANRVACLSNLRQLYMGLSAYAADNKGSFPTKRVPGNLNRWPEPEFWNQWVTWTMVYTGQAKRTDARACWGEAKSIFSCPSNLCTGAGNGYATHYAYNQELSSDGPDDWMPKYNKKPGTWPRQTEIIVLVDAPRIPTYPTLNDWVVYSAYQEFPGTWHGGGYCAVFLDGHAVWEKPTANGRLPVNYFPVGRLLNNLW